MLLTSLTSPMSPMLKVTMLTKTRSLTLDLLHLVVTIIIRIFTILRIFIMILTMISKIVLDFVMIITIITIMIGDDYLYDIYVGADNG